MKRIFDFFKGLGSVATIVGLVVGLPYLGVPFTLDRFDFVVDVFGDPLASESSQVEAALTGLLVVILWIGWAMIVMSLLVEAMNQLRGRAAPSLPVFPGIQTMSRRLVAASTLVYASFSVLAPAVAAGGMPVPVPATMDVGTLAAKSVALPSSDVAHAPVANAMSVQSSDVVESGDAGHTVERGETWWSIAEDYLGDGLRWEEVRNANVGRVMDDGTTISKGTEFLNIGWSIALPGDAAADLDVASVAASDSANEATSADSARSDDETLWVVDDGEHFWMQAEEALRNEWGRQPSEAEIRSHWLDVKSANVTLISSGDVDLIFPGEELIMPAVPADPLAEVAQPAESEMSDVDETEGEQPTDSAAVIEEALSDVEPETVVEVPVVPETQTEAEADVEPTWEEQLGGVGEASESDEDDTTAVGVFESPPASIPTGNSAPVPDGAQSSTDGIQATSQSEAVQSGLPAGLNGTTAAVAFGAAGVLLATYKLRRLERARRWVMHRRKGGEVPGPVDEDLVEIDQEVRQDVNEELVRFYDAAWNSLAARPIADLGHVAQPILGLRDGDELQVLMSTSDQASPAPWACLAIQEDQAIWSVDVSNETLDTFDEGEEGLPLMVTFGENLFVNLEATGPIGLSGDTGRMAGLVRSLAIEATTARLGDDVDVRITSTAATSLGLETQGEPVELIAKQAMAAVRPIVDTLNRHGVANIFAARSALHSYVSSTIVVCDKADTDGLADVLAAARLARTALSVIVLNEASEKYNAFVDESGSMVFGPRGLRCRAAFAAVDLAEMFERLEEQRLTLVPDPVPHVASQPVLDVPVAPVVLSVFDRPDEGLATRAADDVRVPEYLRQSIIDLTGEQPRVMPDPVVDATPFTTANPEPMEPVLPLEPSASTVAPAQVAPVSEAEPAEVVESVAEVAPLEGNAEMLAEVALAPMVVRVLGDVQILGDDVPALSTKELSILTYLALEGDRNQSAIKAAVYGPNAEVKAGTWKAMIRRFRGKIGVDRFPESPDGRYRLVEVTTDYAKFLDEVAAAQSADDQATSLDRYLMAASMIVGQPFGPEPGVDAWSWIDSADNHPRCHMSAKIGDAILGGARLAMEMERYSDAMEIIDRGRVANPYSEELVCLHVEVMLHLDQLASAVSLVEEFEKRMEDEFHMELPEGPRQVLNQMRVAS